MEYHLCTFEINLLYVKSQGLGKWGRQAVEALWKTDKQQVTSKVRPIFKNGVASFNQIFQIQIDLRYDSIEERYQYTAINLEVRHFNQISPLSASTSFNLAEVANGNFIQQKQYQMEIGESLKVCLSINCVQAKKIEGPLRSKKKSGKMVKGDDSFLKLVAVGDQEKPVEEPVVVPTNQTVLTVPPLLSRKISIQKSNDDLVKKLTEDVLKYKRQLQEETQKYQLSKEQAKSFKDMVGNLENQIDSLSADLSHKQTQIIEQHNQIESLKQNNWQLVKKIGSIEPVQKKNYQLEGQLLQMKKELEAVKGQLSRQQIGEVQKKQKLQEFKKQKQILTATVDYLRTHLQDFKKRGLGLQAQVTKLAQQKQNMRMQVKKWRQEWSIEQQQLQEQLSSSQIRFSKLLQKYSDLKQKSKIQKRVVSQDSYDHMIKQEEAKINQFQEKQNIMRDQLVIIQQEMANLHDLLDQKQENGQFLMDHIKKLQYELQGYQLQKKFWERALGKKIIDIQGITEEQDQDFEHKLIYQKNKELMQLLRDSSYTILQSDKVKRELVRVQKQNDEHVKKQDQMQMQLNELKQRIDVLLKENKKLLDKNYKMSKQNQQLNKKTLYQTDQIQNSKQKIKELTDDNEIINYRREQLQAIMQRLTKQNQTLRANEDKATRSSCTNIFGTGTEQGLPVIRETSKQILTSSHLLHKQTQQSHKKNQYTSQDESLHAMALQTIRELAITIEDRIIDSQYVHSHLQQVIESAGSEVVVVGLKQQLKKIQLLSNKIKICLLKSGHSQILSEWDAGLRRLVKQTQKLSMRN